MARLSWRVVFVLSGASATLVPQQATERQIVLRQGIPASESSFAASGGSLSSDGRFVAFVSMSELLPSDTNGCADVYVMDRETSTLTLETPALHRASRHGASGHPRLSGDGRYLVFESDGADLVGGLDTNNTLDVPANDSKVPPAAGGVPPATDRDLPSNVVAPPNSYASVVEDVEAIAYVPASVRPYRCRARTPGSRLHGRLNQPVRRPSGDSHPPPPRCCGARGRGVSLKPGGVERFHRAHRA